MDNNKTPLTHRVTAVAYAWLDGLGCKPVETEVPIASGWTGDVASYWSPTETEARRLTLNQFAAELMDSVQPAKWLELAGKCKLIHQVFGPGPFTVLVEVKVHQPDFSQDDKWRKPPPAHLCFVAYPSGMIDRSDIPNGWFGLETTADGGRLKKLVHGAGCLHPQHPGRIIDFIAAVGVRRDHRTRHAALREERRKECIEDRKKQIQFRAERLLNNLAAWLQRKGFHAEQDFEEMLAGAGIKKLPKYAEEAVRYFRALRDD